jgi:hypothetical protein
MFIWDFYSGPQGPLVTFICNHVFWTGTLIHTICSLWIHFNISYIYCLLSVSSLLSARCSMCSPNEISLGGLWDIQKFWLVNHVAIYYRQMLLSRFVLLSIWVREGAHSFCLICWRITYLHFSLPGCNLYTLLINGPSILHRPNWVTYVTLCSCSVLVSQVSLQSFLNYVNLLSCCRPE